MIVTIMIIQVLFCGLMFWLNYMQGKIDDDMWKVIRDIRTRLATIEKELNK